MSRRFTARTFDRTVRDILRRNAGDRMPVTERVSIDLGRGHAALLDRMCRQTGLDRAAVITRALEAYAVKAGLGADVERARRML